MAAPFLSLYWNSSAITYGVCLECWEKFENTARNIYVLSLLISPSQSDTLVSLLKIHSNHTMCPRRTELGFSKVFDVSGCSPPFYTSLATSLKTSGLRPMFQILSTPKCQALPACLRSASAQNLSVYIFVFCHPAYSSLSDLFLLWIKMCSGRNYVSFFCLRTLYPTLMHLAASRQPWDYFLRLPSKIRSKISRELIASFNK